MKILLRGGTVLALAAKAPNHHEADVLVDGDRIAEVGPGLSARDAEVIDASNTIVMPGFVDAHRLVRMALLRNTGSYDTAVDSLRMAPDDLYAATLIGLLGAIEAGTTTVVDWADFPSDPALVEAARQAHADSGLRTVFVHRGDGGPPTASTTTAHASSDLTQANAVAVAAEWASARRSGLRIHARAGLDPADAGVVAWLGEQGLLGDDVTLVHCTHLGDQDLDAVAASGAAIVVAPSTEMAAGLGVPPLQKFLDRKIEPGLGAGDERLAPGDMLSQMRVANSVQHAAYFDLKLAGKAGLPNLLTTRDVIRYATTEGARVAGLGAVAGSLEVGKQADLIVLRTDRPNIYPINDPIGAVVWGVDSSNLDAVFVAGKALMRDGRLLADVGAARTLATAARDRVMAPGQLTSAGEAT
jgi:5-methylthioadenosine/S-adenosylhomocysteine deaminase